MSVFLQDPTLERDPSARHAFPEAGEESLSPSPTLAEELLADFRAGGPETVTTFEVESRGGYARTVTGTIEYFDGEARTLMVRDRDGELVRVPLREIQRRWNAP